MPSIRDTVVDYTSTQTIILQNSQNSLFGVCTGGTVGITLTLPTTIGNQGRRIRLIKVDSAIGAVNILGLIGGGTYTLGNQHQYVILETEGENWYVIGNN